MKVLFTTTVPSPYRVDFFNELGKHCELTVLFEGKLAKFRDSSWKDFNIQNFKAVFLDDMSKFPYIGMGLKARKHIKKNKYDHIVVTNFLTITGMLIVKFLKRKGIEYYLESDGGFAKNGKGFREKLKKYFISGAKGYFSTADEHDKYYISYGAEKDKLIRYPFSSIKDSDIVKKPVSQNEKQNLRKKLGMTEDKIILSVGRFTYDGGYGKGYDVVLNAAVNLDKNIGIYIVGGKPTDEFISMKERLSLDNVHFINFIKKDELEEYYLASDLFVLMTRGDVWGLVINEAMCYGLPVITTDKCIAGVEMIDDYRCIVSSGSVNQLTSAINQILYDDQLCAKLSKDNLSKAKLYTIDSMVNKHIEILC